MAGTKVIVWVVRILIIHNHYGRYATGGEANVMEAEARLLEEHGHTVMKYERTNAEFDDLGIAGKFRALRQVSWSEDSYRAVKKIIYDFKPHIMHVHNYWFLLTPSIFAAAKDLGATTVMTLHNYRLICPGGQFLYKNRPCELCLDGKPWRALWRRCYPGGSMIKTILSLRLYLASRKRKFLSPWVDAYISLSSFAKSKHVEGGLPREKIHIKPNFMEDPLQDREVSPCGENAVFVGRISPEKGLKSLMKAWQGIKQPLTVVGDGPELQEIKRLAPKNVEFLGEKSRAEALQIIKDAAFLVFPSVLYEGFGLAVLEAMALGRPVLASDLGPRREIVRHGETGLLFRAGDPKDLREKALRLFSDRELCVKMGKAGRKQYLEKYTPEANYQTLMGIYQKAINSSKISGMS